MEVIPIHPILKVNQRLDVILTTAPQAERYPSRVEEIDSRQLILAMPMSKGVPLLLLPNTAFYGRLLVEGTVWLFASRFVDKRLQPLPVWVCEAPHDFKKVQLRAFVRIDTALPAEVRVAGAEPDAPPLAATTKDIGGGGLLLVTKVPLAPGAAVKVDINLGGEFNKLSASAEVLRADYDAERKICCAGVKFVDIPERDRDKIIKYIFKKQLERRQKGIGV